MTDDLVNQARLSLWSAYCDMKMELGDARNHIKELEATVAMWKGIHEGAVLAMQGHIKELEAALRKIADIEHEDLPKPAGAAEGTLWAILAGCVEVARKALEGKDE